MSELKRTIKVISSNADENTAEVPSEPPRKFSLTMPPKKVISQVNAAFLSNRFNGLPIDEPPAPQAAKVKIPPIVIKHIKFANLLTLLSSLQITEFQTKFMSEGIKVLLSDLDTYDKLNNHLESQSIQFYTFSVKNKLPVKIVLSQLPKLDVNEIKTEINSQVQPLQLNCEEVRQINTKISRYEEYALYIVSFTRDKFNINNLRSIPGLFHVKVRWNSYRKRGGPTQCSNCWSFGHGNNHCHLTQKCRLCSGPHDETVCEHLNSYEEGIYVSVKCSNCSGQHPANHPLCPKREDFIEMRQKLSSRSNANSQRRNAGKQNNMQYNNINQFPPLPQPQFSSHQTFTHQTQANMPQQSSRSQQPNQGQQYCSTQSQNTSNFWQSNNQRTHSVPRSAPQGSNDMFSTNELIQLSQELFTALSGCKNKSQQFAVLTELTIKYLHGRP